MMPQSRQIKQCVFLNLNLTLILLVTCFGQSDARTKHHYVSEGFCNKLAATVRRSISQQQPQLATPLVLPSESNMSVHAPSGATEPYISVTFRQTDDCKYPFWLRCMLTNSTSGTPTKIGFANRVDQADNSNEVDLISEFISHFDIVEREEEEEQQQQDEDEETTAAAGHEYDDEDARRQRNYLNPLELAHDKYWSSSVHRVNDDNYHYLLGVSKYCHRHLSKLCPGSYRLGPLDISSGKKNCSTCGNLNDTNCDNVHQCVATCGQIKSINYPNNYGNNHRCRWSIRAPNGHYVNLSVIDFDIPSANNASKLGTCIFDYLTLIDGYTGKRIGCYCNENRPPASIVSPWNELIIQLDTNSETTGRGFYFQYEFMKLELNENILGQLLPIDGYSITTTLPAGAANPSGSNLTTASNETTAAVATNNVCPSGWQYFRGSCYRAFNEIEPLQWYDAENKCNLFGEGLDGHLVSILDKDEMLIIMYWLTNVWRSVRYREYYIGLIDVSREGLYRWSDNNPMSYTDWELIPMLLEDETPAQPDGGAYEDCTVIRYNSFSRTSNWHDVPCSLGKHYHSHLEKAQHINFKWDYVSSYICKSDSISIMSSATRTRVRRPLFSNEFKLSLQDEQLTSHLQSRTTNSNSNSNKPSQITSNGTAGTQTSLSVGQQITNTTGGGGATLEAPAPTPVAGESAVEYANSDQTGGPSSAIALRAAESAAADDHDIQIVRKNHQHLARLLDDNRYFICDNLEVISTVLRCDGVAHCRDGSDESTGCDQECLDWQFKCANGRCISIGKYCDFVDDCGDGSDESRCERLRCKLNEFKCQSGQCINATQRCDLIPDCYDSSDEGRSCTIGSNCNSISTFQCYNGNCIPQYAVCDFQIDCPGKFHEDEDAATCKLIQKSQTIRIQQQRMLANASSMSPIQQLTAMQLMPQSIFDLALAQSDNQQTKLYTNHTSHRRRHRHPHDQYIVFYSANQAIADEAQAYMKSMNLFQCTSGNMIDNNLRCLYEFDRYGYQIGCRDVSHLRGCADFVCPQRDYVKCSNSYCIPWRYVCDGKWDCIMGEDEVGCARYVCPSQYKCANQSSCILLHQLCDGLKQCPMGDDEWFCDLQCPSNCDCIGQAVSCRHANLVALPNTYISKAVRKLDLSYNHLGPNLSSCNFDAYHDLGELILSHNNIEVLIPRKFHQLRNLYKLDLSHNQIHSVKRGAFAGLRRVTQLLLESNQQLFLLEPEAFLGLSSLKILNISSSRIQSLRKNTFDGLTSLRHLQLRSNMILSVEDGAFRSLSSLVSLDMRGNDIKSFTKSIFSDLKSLRNLSTDSFKFCCLVNHQIPADRCLPLPDEISDCEDLLSSVPQRTCIWLAGSIACIGNVIVIIWRYRDRLGQKEREAEQINSTLLLSLACSDLMMGVYLIVIALVDSWYRGYYIENADKWRGSLLCNLCGFLSTVSSTVSVLTLVFIAYNRYLEICRPFNAPKKFTLGYTQRLIKLSWCLALTIAIVPLIIYPYFKGQFYARSGVCLAFHITDRNVAGWFYSILVSPCVNLVAFLVILKSYMGIYSEISQAANRNYFITERQTNHQSKIVLIVLTHLIAFSPPIILGFMSLAGYTPRATLYSWIAVLVLPLNSAINPMIYTIPNIRHTIRLLIANYRARKSGALAVAATRSSASLTNVAKNNVVKNNVANQQQQHQLGQLT